MNNVSSEKVLTMVLERNIRTLANGVHSPVIGNKSTPIQNPNQGIATLLVMIAVLTIIILFCCFSAPGIRSLCKRYIFRTCPYDDPNLDNGSTQVPESTTPTVILLPYGRMLVVDRSVFNQLQVDHTGIDFMELSADLIRAESGQYRITNSTPSVFIDSDNTSKGMSPTSLGFSPPAYEDIFGKKALDLPPSYSEVSIILKNQQIEECIEMSELNTCREEGRTKSSVSDDINRVSENSFNNMQRSFSM
ncbi:uncharacterized protein LOC132699390 isoform X1 [Cylas formicarius]|uniref:uncharacterized protein LOC132699390 isoform X1 n=1 Tax=Cylas formicarius TaxID=197179 RepID=UPI002958A7E4|nr:uncharacterized protein LOC132699390 isoform X1 [Cylas formicarius]